MTRYLSREQALAGAIASSEMEGLPISDEDRALLEKWVTGELTGDEVVAEFIASVTKGKPPTPQA